MLKDRGIEEGREKYSTKSSCAYKMQLNSIMMVTKGPFKCYVTQMGVSNFPENSISKV